MGARGFLGTTRRKFIAGIAAVLAAGPLAAQTQPQGGMRRLGVPAIQPASDRTGQANEAALVQGLGVLDRHEGGNPHIDWRRAGSDVALYKRYAAELLSLGPDILVAQGSPAVEALRRQTRTIPIVFVMVSDPVGQGFVDRLGAAGRCHYRLHQLRSANGQQMAADADPDQPARRPGGGPQALGVTIAPPLLAAADEIIE